MKRGVYSPLRTFTTGGLPFWRPFAVPAGWNAWRPAGVQAGKP